MQQCCSGHLVFPLLQLLIGGLRSVAGQLGPGQPVELSIVVLVGPALDVLAEKRGSRGFESRSLAEESFVASS